MCCVMSEPTFLRKADHSIKTWALCLPVLSYTLRATRNCHNTMIERSSSCSGRSCRLPRCWLSLLRQCVTNEPQAVTADPLEQCVS